MHMLSSRRNEAEADWVSFRNEAEAADAAAETRREADSDDARIEADAIEAEQAEQSNAGPEPLFLEDLLVQIETIIDTAATGPEVHADRQADFFSLIEHQARAARATLVAETDLLPPSDDREQFGDDDEFH